MSRLLLVVAVSIFIALLFASALQTYVQIKINQTVQQIEQ